MTPSLNEGESGEMNRTSSLKPKVNEYNQSILTNISKLSRF